LQWTRAGLTSGAARSTGATEKGAKQTSIATPEKLVCGQVTSRLNLSMQEHPIQLFHKLNESFWILLAAGCFGKYSPISNLGFHWSTS
jgi:hypothetical protein